MDERVSLVRGLPVEHPKRWLMLALFCPISLTNACAWITFTPISRQTAQFYSIGEQWVIMLALVYMIVYIGCVWVGAWTIEKKGLRFGVVMGGTLNLVGSLLRVGGASPNGFWLTLIGQIVLGSGQVFISEAPPKLSANWFSRDQRSVSTAIGLMSNLLGIGLGFFISPFVVHRKQELPILLYLEAALCGAASLLAILFFRGEPPPNEQTEKQPNRSHEHDLEPKDQTVDKPTQIWQTVSYQHGESLAELAQERDEEESEKMNQRTVTVPWWTRSYWHNIRQLLGNRDFVILMLSFGIAVGGFYTIVVLFQQLVLLPSREVGVLGMLFMSSGIAGSIVAGVILDSTHRYGLFTKVGFGGLLVSYIWLIFSGAGSRNFIMKSFPASCLGFFMTAIFTLSLEAAVECTIPIPEGTTAGLLMLCAHCFGVIFISVMQATERFTLHSRHAKFAISHLILMGALLFSFILVLFFKGKPHNNEDEEHPRGTPTKMKQHPPKIDQL